MRTSGRGSPAGAIPAAGASTTARYPGSAPLHQTRQRALTTLREINAQANPLRFIVYSQMAGRGLAPVRLNPAK